MAVFSGWDATARLIVSVIFRLTVVDTANFSKLHANEMIALLVENVRELKLPARETELIAIQEKQVTCLFNPEIEAVKR